MAWINKFDFGLFNVFGLRPNGGVQAAVLMRQQGGNQGNAPAIEAFAVHANGLPGWSSHTAIVNAIQAQARQGNLSNLLVFSTYVPTQACLGMMKTHNLHSVTHYTGGQKHHVPVRAVANVANMVPAGYPALNQQNRVWVPGNQTPPNGLIADPTANVGGVTAAGYLNALHGVQNNLLNNWRATWQPGPQPAAARGIAPFQQFLAAGQATQGALDTLFMLFTYAVAGRVYSQGPSFGSRIAAVLVGSQGQIYGWQVNARSINTTFHAETNLIQGIGQVPQNTTLYSTLEPCHQCSGIFVRAGGTRCVFGQNDPNMTNNTALQNINAVRFAGNTVVLPGNVFTTGGQRLDQIRDRATVFAQAAAVGRRFQQGGTVQNALANANYQNIQVRVLNILSAPPTLEMFRQADAILGRTVQIMRQNHLHGHPARRVTDNIGQALGY